MERKVVVRSQQSLSVVFVSVTDLSLVRSEIAYALLSFCFISCFHFTLFHSLSLISEKFLHLN